MITKGQKLNDRYQIIKSIGEGGMANVYLALDTILERNVAVKVLRGDLANDEKFVRRFQREALSASSLNHLNIVEVYDVGEDSGKYFIVMEYVEGKTLKELIKKRGSLTLPEVIDIMSQLTEGLASAHDAYIIHRDIKPQNILILDNGLVKITDFGIAMAMNSTQLTQTNSVMGSVHYLPPEQANGQGATIKSDIYSLGILMYELLTGAIPFKGDNAVEIALKHMQNKMPSIRSENNSVPQSIENIILKATAKNPKNRYNDAREMNEDLKTALLDTKSNVAKITFKHSENDLDITRIIKPVKQDESIAKQINTDPKKPNYLMIGVISLISFFAFLMLLFVIIIPSLTRIPSKKIPDVKNKSVADASNILTDLGFEVEIETEKLESETIEEGFVIKTSPEIGRTIKINTKIVLYESSGPNTILIENYSNKHYEAIKAILESKGLVVNKETKIIDNPDDYETDIIIDQNPREGLKLKKGDKITLFVAYKNVYPDMVTERWTINEVIEFCDEFGLEIEKEEIPIENEPVGIILSQNRIPGSIVTKGAILKVTYAGPPIEIGD